MNSQRNHMPQEHKTGKLTVLI